MRVEEVLERVQKARTKIVFTRTIKGEKCRKWIRKNRFRYQRKSRNRGRKKGGKVRYREVQFSWSRNCVKMADCRSYKVEKYYKGEGGNGRYHKGWGGVGKIIQKGSFRKKNFLLFVTFAMDIVEIPERTTATFLIKFGPNPSSGWDFRGDEGRRNIYNFFAAHVVPFLIFKHQRKNFILKNYIWNNNIDYFYYRCPDDFYFMFLV